MQTPGPVTVDVRRGAAVRRRPRDLRGWSLAALLALLGHGLAWQCLVRPATPGAPAPALMTVRMLPLPQVAGPGTPTPHAPPEALQVAAPPASPRLRPSPVSAPAPRDALPAPAPLAVPSVTPLAVPSVTPLAAPSVTPPAAPSVTPPAARAVAPRAAPAAAAVAASPRPSSSGRAVSAAGASASAAPAPNGAPSGARIPAPADDAGAGPTRVVTAGSAADAGRRLLPETAGPDDDPLMPEAPAAVADARQLRELPVYPVALPPPFERRFEVRRGDRRGEAVLRFEPGDEDGYRLHFAWGDSERTWLTLDSTGAAGRTGLLPRLFTDRRPGRSPRSSRFDREAATVQVGPRGRPQPLALVGQDRLSWWVQLPAIVRARAGGPRAGERFSLQVAGVRGAPALWHFDNRGPVELDGEPGPGTAAWHFRREPQSPYDLQVDVWLDPQDGFLPVQVAITPVPGTGGVHFRRVASTPGAALSGRSP